MYGCNKWMVEVTTCIPSQPRGLQFVIPKPAPTTYGPYNLHSVLTEACFFGQKQSIIGSRLPDETELACIVHEYLSLIYHSHVVIGMSAKCLLAARSKGCSRSSQCIPKGRRMVPAMHSCSTSITADLNTTCRSCIRTPEHDLCRFTDTDLTGCVNLGDNEENKVTYCVGGISSRLVEGGCKRCNH
jgi:hypothetical protein